MTTSEKINLFEAELAYIEHDDIREFVKIAIDNFPNYFFEVAASSSGKFHSNLERGFGGLVYHTKSVAKVANYLTHLEQYKIKLGERGGDIVIASCICHDCMKHGLENKTGYSVFEHPLFAKQFIENTSALDNIIPDEERAIVAMACESHSGEWNTNKRSNVILAKPMTLVQELVHLSDYISSRSDIHILFDEDTAKPTLPDPHTYVFGFGNRYPNMLLSEVVSKHHDYIDWMRSKGINREPLMTLIKMLEDEEEDKI